MQANKSPGATTLKPLCTTRWTVCTAAIDAALKNYTVLCEALAEINQDGRDEYAMQAGGYLSLMEKFVQSLVLISHSVFSANEQLSITLQAKDTTLQEAVSASHWPSSIWKTKGMTVLLNTHHIKCMQFLWCPPNDFDLPTPLRTERICKPWSWAQSDPFPQIHSWELILGC